MSQPNEEPEVDPALILLGLTVLVAACSLCWLIAAATTLIGSGGLPRLSVVDAVAGAIRLVADGLWSAPRDAYPDAAARRMPGVALWWLCAGCVSVATAAAAVSAFRRFEPQVARTRLARRPGDVR
ncbi:MAG: hypothetical protein ACR2NB_04190, partial [Solirubrobacteraceae bacterium]